MDKINHNNVNHIFSINIDIFVWLVTPSTHSLSELLSI